MKYLIALATLGLSLSSPGATRPRPVEEVKLGGVKAYKRIIPIDLESCQKEYHSGGTLIGICAVKVEVKDQISQYGNSVRSVIPLSTDGHRRIVFEGMGDSFTIEYDDLDGGKADWASVGDSIRSALESKYPELKYEIIIFKIEGD